MNTSERHERVTSIFLDACRAEPDRRAAFLDGACGDDAALRAEVEAMLAADESAPGTGVPDEPALGPGFGIRWTAHDGAAPAASPLRVGHYRILEVIGEGGMSVVYLAEQDRPHRRVALKVLGSGLASRRVLRRFELEAEMLGRLAHPGIARIFEAGVADAGFGPQPFFAMEYVEGAPLTTHAEAHALDTRARLELIARVCDAVQHAHQKGVVHRDLKPGNILVDRSGQPRILDFGVARTTDADLQVTTTRTAAGQLMGTVPYMSPEQTRGDPDAVDTRSDVYAIGVVAYELLAGRLPYDVARRVVHEAVRIIQESEPAPLSSVDRAHRGDLDTIVAKTLEKDPARRYQSASDLAADIRRHLNDEPIVARRTGVAYQLRKMARRHRTVAAVVVTLAVALCVGTIATAWQAVRATRAETAARELADAERRQRAIAEAINAFLTEDLLAAVAPSVEPARGRNVTVREVLDQAARRIERAARPGGRFHDQALVEAAVRRTLGRTYFQLGEYEAAAPHLERARVLTAQTLGVDHSETLDATRTLGILHRAARRSDEAVRLHEAVLATRRRTLGPDAPATLRSAHDLATTYRRAGRLADAEPLQTQALEGLRRALGNDDPATLSAALGLGRLYEAQARYDEAETLFVDAVDGRRRTLGDDHRDTLDAMDDLAGLYESQGRSAEAVAIAEPALAGQVRVLGEDHPDTLATMDTLGSAYRTLRRLDEAETLRVRSLEGHRRALGEEHTSTLVAMQNLAAVYYDQARYDEAESIMKQVIEIQERVYGEESAAASTSMTSLAAVYVEQGRYEEATPLLLRSLDQQRRKFGDDHPSVLFSTLNLAQAYREQQRFEEARALQAQAVASARRVWPDGTWYIGGFLRDLGETLRRMERYEEAEGVLVEAHAILDAALGTEHARTAAAVESLAVMYDAWGREEEATAWRAKLEAPVER